jgi:hypothetical protein
VVAVLVTSACSGTAEAPATSSSAPSASASSTSAQPSPSESSTSASPSPTLDPEAQKAAAFQLCGTVLALSAGFIGQVAPSQLEEGRVAVDAAREAYVDDGSGLLQKADAVIAAVDDATTPKVITTSQELAAACKGVAPE